LIKLTTERLLIRDYIVSDLEDLHSLISDKKNMYLVDDIFSNSIEETSENLENAMKNEDGHYFAICDIRNGEFIGSVGYTYTTYTLDCKVAHLGYFILPQHHGKGYTTEAVKKVLEFAFKSGGCTRITTGCYSEHIASIRVMEKAGFRRESEHLNAAWHDGVLKDRLEYAIDVEGYLA